MKQWLLFIITTCPDYLELKTKKLIKSVLLCCVTPESFKAGKTRKWILGPTLYATQMSRGNKPYLEKTAKIRRRHLNERQWGLHEPTYFPNFWGDAKRVSWQRPRLTIQQPGTLMSARAVYAQGSASGLSAVLTCSSATGSDVRGRDFMGQSASNNLDW